jgi:hypothetical protein
MPKAKDDALVKAAREAVQKYGSQSEAARRLGIARETLKSRLERGRTGEVQRDTEVDNAVLKDQIRTLRAQLAAAKQATLTDEMVKREILKVAEMEPEPPDWLTRPPKKAHVTGTPVVFASDWHWGEVVQASQINGVNSYDLAIAQRRARTLIEVTIDLLKTRFANPEYPGIVFALGGDLCSGDIHEELSATNETEIMPVLVDLFGVLCWCIETLANEFGNVFVPCVTGNHARVTHKMRAKGRAFTSYEWLLYNLAAARFASDRRVRFQIPSGPDAMFRVHNTRICLSHGDQFRGGQGLIGHWGAVFRGNNRKRSRNAQVKLDFDLLMLGHFHSYGMIDGVVTNGSLVGMSEYGWAGNFSFEQPRQALFLVHPTIGPTFAMPVYVERPPVVKDSPWVSWKEDAR